MWTPVDWTRAKDHRCVVKHALRACLAIGLWFLSSCSKENSVAAGGPTGGVGQQCQLAEQCGASAVCALGFCRLGCTIDAECAQGSLCVGDQPPYGCSTPAEGACSAAAPCPAGLECGIDGRCRHACATNADCPRNEHKCVAGTCASTSEPGAETTWFACLEGEEACVSRDASGAPTVVPKSTTQPRDYCFIGGSCPANDDTCARRLWAQNDVGDSIGTYTTAREASVHVICNVVGPGWQVLKDCGSWGYCVSALPVNTECFTAKTPPLPSAYCGGWAGDQKCEEKFLAAEQCFDAQQVPTAERDCWSGFPAPTCCEGNEPVCQDGATGTCAAPYFNADSPGASCTP